MGTVTAGPSFSPTEHDRALAAAVPERRTHRRVYRSNQVAEEDLLDLRQAVAEEGARLTVADSGSRRRLSHLLRRAVRAQARDTELVDEVDRWVRRSGEAADDGIPAAALGTGPFPIDSLVHDARQATVEAADLEEELARSTLLVIATRGDTRLDWVVAGMALERMLLEATVKGLVVTFTEQALQQSEIRPQVAELLGIWGHPQVLLRIGRPLVEAPPTPRRPLADVLD